MLFDLHIHSQFSPCSELPLEKIVERALTLGLDGVCITDHNTMAARRHIREGVRGDGLCVIIGLEYDTPDGDFLLFGPFEKLPHGLRADELLLRVREEGGVAVACHPLRAGRSVSEGLISSGLCTLIETINGRNKSVENERAKALCRLYQAHACGGSDAHTAAEVGKVLTRFSVPVRSRDDLVEALRNGHCSPLMYQDKDSEMVPDQLLASGQFSG